MARSCEFEPKNEIDAASRPFDFTRLAVPAIEQLIACRRLLPLRAHVEQVYEEVISERFRPLREHTKLGIARCWCSVPAVRQ